MTEFYNKVIELVYQKQVKHNQTIFADINEGMDLQESDKQQYITDSDASSSYNHLFKSIFIIKKKQNKMNAKLLSSLKDVALHEQSQYNQDNKEQQMQQKLCPNNKNLKRLKNTENILSEKKSFRTREKIKTQNLQQIIRLKTEGTLSNISPNDDMQIVFSSGFKQKNQYLKQQLQKKQRILQLYKEKSKLHHRLQQINTQLINIRKERQNKSVTDLKCKVSVKSNTMKQKPFVFLSPKNSHNQLSLPKNNRIANKSSILPALQKRIGRSPKQNPESLTQQAEKTDKAVQFILRINRQALKRKQKFQKFQQRRIIENIKSVNLSCSRKRCRKEVLKDKIRQIQK